MKTKYNENNVSLGFTKKIAKRYTLIVTSSNRKHVPSFHVIDCKTCGKQFDSKISLTECRYLHDSPDILNQKQKDELVKLLNTKTISILGKIKNVWFDYFYAFKISNNCDLDIDTKIPDYSKLPIR